MAKRKLDTVGVTIKMGAKSQIIETKTGDVIADFTAHGAKVYNFIENATRNLSRMSIENEIAYGVR